MTPNLQLRSISQFMQNAEFLYFLDNALMELSVKIVIDGKPLTIFAKSSILNIWLGYEYATGISRVKRNLKVKFTFNATV